MELYFIIFLVAVAQCQFFDPVMDDKTYLDRIDQQLLAEVESSAMELIQQTKEAEKVTKSYISIKLKDNVFKALRALALADEVEFEEKIKNPSRAGRQESGSGGSGDAEGAEAEQSEGGDDDTATEKATTPLTGLSTAVKINQNVFQFIGEAIKTIFKGVGGKKSYVRAGTSSGNSSLTEVLPDLMKKPYAEQLVGILNLLAEENGDKKSNTVTVEKNPFKAIFGNRGRKGEAGQKEVVVEYIENLRQNHPQLLPDLNRGILEPQRLLRAMSNVVSGIQQDIHI